MLRTNSDLARSGSGLEAALPLLRRSPTNSPEQGSPRQQQLEQRRSPVRGRRQGLVLLGAALMICLLAASGSTAGRASGQSAKAALERSMGELRLVRMQVEGSLSGPAADTITRSQKLEQRQGGSEERLELAEPAESGVEEEEAAAGRPGAAPVLAPAATPEEAAKGWLGSGGEEEEPQKGNEGAILEAIKGSSSGSDSSSSSGSAPAAAAATRDGKQPSESGSGAASDAARLSAPASPYQQAAAACRTFSCLKIAAGAGREREQFLAPHFLVVNGPEGVPHSLKAHLDAHPSVLAPSDKAPARFAQECGFKPLSCTPEQQRSAIDQIVPRLAEGGMQRAAYLSGEVDDTAMAKGMHQAFPWARVLVTLREPISRAVALLSRGGSAWCLNEGKLFGCLQKQLAAPSYSAALAPWLDAFPHEQLLLVQAEALAADDSRLAALYEDLQQFLGFSDATMPQVDPAPVLSAAQPTDAAASSDEAASADEEAEAEESGEASEEEEEAAAAEDAPSAQPRRQQVEQGGLAGAFPMSRKQLQTLIDLARPEAEALAALVEERGLGSARLWNAAWEKAWQASLNTCTLEDQCFLLAA